VGDGAGEGAQVSDNGVCDHRRGVGQDGSVGE
jgi:hypothetical protein